VGYPLLGQLAIRRVPVAITTALLVGFILGLCLAIWFLFGDRLRWGLPSNESLDDEFTSLNPLWTTICIGDAAVQLLSDADATGGGIARMVVRSAVEGQLALAQIDDYIYRPFADYAWRPPLYAEARLRVSQLDAPGTLGFWFWNNGMGLGAELPDFRPFKWLGFYRIPPGATMAYTGVADRYRAAVMDGSWLGLARMFGVPLLPKLRATEVGLDARADWTQWHTYGIEWQPDRIRLLVDGEAILTSAARIRKSNRAPSTCGTRSLRHLRGWMWTTFACARRPDSGPSPTYSNTL
jgi:hypothetical protein